ncbi:6,7-dimethyl-8-ribityllumazine synthase [Pelagibacteraceae bacterium]|nr:6,7-dimethyl-8-ribityllumazine synthase [Pelagibacteraceae bacterium]
MKKKVLIVISDYYEEIGKNLLKGSINELKLNNINYDILFAPGCFEIPFLISKNIKKYKGFIALGCVIRGETYHFELISNECARKIIDISNEHLKPIGFGILTCENIKQAKIRSDIKKKNKGKEAANACIKLL